MDAPRPTMAFRVTGQVQHVWFRGWTQLTARNLGLAGWVRNMPDGSVEGVAQAASASGTHRAALDVFCEALRQGPPSARVSEVELSEVDEPEAFADFSVRR